MEIYVEPPISKAPTLVVVDGSDFAKHVAESIKVSEKRKVKVAELSQYPSLILQQPVVFVLARDSLTPAVMAIVARQRPRVSLLISENVSAVTDCAAHFSDVMLWPEASAFVVLRMAILSRLYDNDHQVEAMRRSLAWHKARVEREHQLVEHIFQNALSRNYLDFEHVRTYLTPVSKFNGDLCLIAPGPLGNIYMLMADFTGHGLAPATGALPLSQAFFAMSDRGVSVAEMVTEFNYRMNRLLPNDMFCAAILLELSANGERVTYWNGGMPPALLFDKRGEILKRLNPAHMALGVIDDDEFDSRVTTFRAPKQSSI